jgi:hypothetical protein
MTGIDEEADLIMLFENQGQSSVNNTQGKVHTKVYPNPSSNGWNVSAGDKQWNELRLIDADGKIVAEVTRYQSEVFIPSNALPDGVYILEVMDSNHHVAETHRVVLQR